MMDDFFSKPARRHIRDLNLVPIIDMFTTVVFFLLLSTGFLAFTKLTIPPSQVSVISSPENVAPPLSPKLLAWQGEGRSLRLALSWGGKDPGELTETVRASGRAGASSESGGSNDISEEQRTAAFAKARELVAKFQAKYPSEKTLQLGLGSTAPYQMLVALMDGAREAMPDIVLVSPDESDLRATRGSSQDGKEGAAR